jgi:hypothetical protein
MFQSDFCRPDRPQNRLAIGNGCDSSLSGQPAVASTDIRQALQSTLRHEKGLDVKIRVTWNRPDGNKPVVELGVNRAILIKTMRSCECIRP